MTMRVSTSASTMHKTIIQDLTATTQTSYQPLITIYTPNTDIQTPTANRTTSLTLTTPLTLITRLILTTPLTLIVTLTLTTPLTGP